MESNFIKNLSDILEKLPGVGPKTAERFVFYLLKQPREETRRLIAALEQVSTRVRQCRLCQNFSLSDPCDICADPRRDHSLICVVAEPADLTAMEKTNEYQGVYHILGGVIDAPSGQTPDKLKIREFLRRLDDFKKRNPAKRPEIILGLNATIEGETTSFYLARLLKPLGVRLTRLARGLPQGSDLQYADEVTLLNALNGRREM